MARTVDTDKKHVADVLRAAAEHEGAAFVEIYQNCNVFNDGAFDALREKETRKRNMIVLEAGKPIRFGEDNERGVVHKSDGSLEVVEVADVGRGRARGPRPGAPRPVAGIRAGAPCRASHRPDSVGVFRSVRRPTYAEGLHDELEQARSKVGDAELEALLTAGDTWTVPASS